MTQPTTVRTTSTEHHESTTPACPECGSNQLVTSSDGGERHCDDCGLVVDDDRIDPGPEWRAFTDEEHKTRRRVGAPLSELKHDRGLTTQISWRNIDAHGRTVSPRRRSTLNRLRDWQERIRTEYASERNLQYALSEIERMAAALGVPKTTREPAARLYRRALDEDLIRERSIEAIASVALYIACRRETIPRSIKEIAAVSRVERKEIARAHLYLVRELDLELVPIDPAAYVPRFCSALDLGDAVERTAIDIIEETADNILSGSSPTGFAAGAIYAASLICDEKRPQHAVADVAKVTEITVRKHYQNQLEAFDP